MKGGLLAVIAAVLTFMTVMFVVVTLTAFGAGFGLTGRELWKFLGAALLCGLLAAGAWYASGLGRKDDWPR